VGERVVAEGGTRCPGDDDLAAWVDGVADDALHARVTEHVDGCARCLALVAAAAHDGGVAPKARGERVGRYVVLAPVAAGAMGVVYAAYDPDLDRKVALKLLRPDGPDDAREALRGRLLAEARALARLSHPHVVAVHDVGAVGDELFLAMELVAGTTLRAWLAAGARSWREIVPALAAAGGGLAAAHEAGVVHRDFKPDNVLVGDDGRVRVADFGLARDHELSEASAATRAPLRPGRATRTGALAGTPAYMAPEQLAGGGATRASDPYAFARTLAEALGERDGSSRGVPAGVRAVVARGLAEEPAARFPSMRAMLDALAAAERRSRRRPMLALAIAGVIGAMGLGGAALRRAPAPRDPCESSATSFDAAWGGSTRAAALAAFGAAGRTDAFGSVDRELARYASRFREADRFACAAARIQRTEPEAALERRRACLAGRLRDAQALARGLATVGAAPERAEHALDAARSLADPARCASPDLGTVDGDPLPHDPAQRAAILRFEDELASARGDLRLGFGTDALGRLRALVDTATSLGWESGRARALLAVAGGEVALAGGDPRRTATAAAAAALSAHDDETLTDAWLVIADVEALGHRRAEVETAAEMAGAANRRLGTDPVREAARLVTLARVLVRTGRDLDRALELYATARALLVAARGPEDVGLADLDARVGAVRHQQARYDDARALRGGQEVDHLGVVGSDLVFGWRPASNDPVLLKRVPLAGGAVEDVAITSEKPLVSVLAFVGDDAWFLAGAASSFDRFIVRAPASGGTATTVVKLASGSAPVWAAPGVQPVPGGVVIAGLDTFYFAATGANEAPPFACFRSPRNSAAQWFAAIGSRVFLTRELDDDNGDVTASDLVALDRH
jgi:hypothetical protein